MFNGPTRSAETALDSSYPVLVKYFNENNIDSLVDRMRIAEQFYDFVGLGQATITPFSILVQNLPGNSFLLSAFYTIRLYHPIYCYIYNINKNRILLINEVFF